MRRPPPTAQVEAILQWEVMSEDFVYCLALSRDMQYVAYGGTAKKAVGSGVTVFMI